MLALRLMPSTCSVARADRTSDGQGGWMPNLVAHATGTPCKYDPQSHIDEVVGDQERERLEGRLFVPLGTDILRHDIVTLDDGRTLKVLAVEPPGGRSVAGAGGQVRVAVEDLQGGGL